MTAPLNLPIVTSNVPAGAPAGCPRASDGTSGPRRCSLAIECPHHLQHPEHKGPSRAAARVRLAVKLPDTCSVDVAERGRLSELRGNPLPSVTEIAIVLGITRQAASALLHRALKKQRLAILRMLRKLDE